MFTVSDVIKATNGELLSGLKDRSIKAVSIDSRTIGEQELFFAIRGENFDGHDYLEEVFSRGASGAIVEKEPGTDLGSNTVVKVQSTLGALGDLASAWRKSFPQLKLAAITGSNGKTTTKEMAWSILSISEPVLKNSGNFNNLIGLPLTLLQLKPEHQSAVVELGMNDFGEIERLAEICAPDVGLITNIGSAHLEKLGSVDGVAKAKGELVENFTDNNIFVVNMDDERVRTIASSISCEKITYGIEYSNAQLRATDIKFHGTEEIEFDLNIDGRTYPVKIKGIGRHNVMNALGASGIALAFGCGGEEIARGLSNYRPVDMRLEVLQSRTGASVINDCYNANPDSMRNAISELMRLRGGGVAIAVLGDMLELGERSEQAHRELGEFASHSGVDYLVAYGNYARSVIEGFGKSKQSSLVETHGEAAEIVLSMAQENDVVLVKGSRGMRMEEVVNRLV